MAKEEIRVFVSEEINKWLEEKAEEGVMGDNKSEVVRSYLRDLYRGVLTPFILKGESEEGKTHYIENPSKLIEKIEELEEK